MRRGIYKVFVALTLSVYLFLSCGKTDMQSTSVGGSESTIIETGEIVAVNSWNYTMPRFGRYWNQMMIIGILEHGSVVKQGDSIVQFDPATVNKYIIGREDALETQQANLEKMYVNHDNIRNNFKSSIESSVASLEMKKIELEATRFEPEKTKRIKELEFQQAEITLTKERRRLELSDVINESDMVIQKTKVSQIEFDILNAKQIIPKLTVRAAVDGVFQISYGWRSGRKAMLKVGDNIYTGNSVASVPQIKWMKVETTVDETDFRKISIGQKIAIRLDALPKVVFNGEVSYIGKLCHYKDNDTKSRQKVFDVQIKLLESDERLKPGMTVSCEYL